MYKNLFITLLALGIMHTSWGQVNFNRGVNLTNWFQAGSARQIQFSKYTKQDLINIKELGCDVIRLPINLHFMTSGSPDYTIDPLLYTFLDQVVNWAEELQINLILDNHSFDPVANTDPNVGTVLNKVWAQMAQHYKDRSEYILFEILNEPHGITTQQWGIVQKNAIDVIRLYDIKHTIVVGASGYNSYGEMKDLPVYSDAKLLYTFHFYDPFMFTHQGASWSSPSMEPLSGVPFPADATSIPACPASLKGTWIESSLNNYVNDGTVAKVKQLLDIAVSFKNTRNVKVFCGEFGVYIPNSNNAHRVYWYGEVRKYLEEKGIPWTTWDYQGGFGLFTKGSNEIYENDLNTQLLQSLGLNVPEQKPFVFKADSVGFPLYRDFVESKINASGSGGVFDFYNTTQPNNDAYCLYWANAPQYNSVVFDFSPDKDFSRLVTEGYSLDFMIRGNSSSTKFDIRFLDTKTSDPNDHPWRMRTTVDNASLFDKYWHHVHIPLTSFTEQGAWDNNTWYEPNNKFDWKAVDRLEIVSEYEALTGKKVWFDNVCITNQDTAQVLEPSILNGIKQGKDFGTGVKIYPNPMADHLQVEITAFSQSYSEVSIYSLTGSKVADVYNNMLTAGKNTLSWNNSAGNLPAGIYLLKVKMIGEERSFKLVIRI